MTLTATKSHSHVRTRSCTQPKLADCEMNKLTNHELSKLISSRPYKSRSQRPCDFCRKRKTCCILEGGIPCLNCKKLNDGNCSFNEGPIKRVYKRKRRSRIKRSKQPGRPKAERSSETPAPDRSSDGERNSTLTPLASSTSISSASYSVSDPHEPTPHTKTEPASLMDHTIASKMQSSYVLTTLSLDSLCGDESPLFDEFLVASERQSPRDYRAMPAKTAETFFDDMSLDPDPYKRLDNFLDHSLHDPLFADDFDDNIMHALGEY